MKNSKISLLPLYIADALVFLFVASCAIPPAISGKSISGIQTFACCTAVLLGMFLMLVPYILDYKKDIAKKHEHTDEARKNFEIIFDELAALRMALADLVERVENDEEKIVSLPTLEKGFEEIKRNLQNLTGDISNLRADNTDSISKLESLHRNAKQTIEEIGADIVVLKESLSASNESTISEIEKLKNQFDNLNVASTEIPESEESVNDDSSEEVLEEELERPRSKIEVGHLLRRALANADESKNSVEKFLARTTSSTETSQDKILEETETIEEIKEETSEENDSDDDPNFFEDADSPVSVESAENIEVAAEKITSEVPRETELSEQEIPVQEIPVTENTEQEAMLFEDLPISRGKIKPKKGDAVIIVNALIGIGNKPFLRGNGAGLSPDKGTPMDYLEIGKWRYVLPEFENLIDFTILKNDLTPPSGDSNFTINVGEKKELNLVFPIEQELF